MSGRIQKPEPSPRILSVPEDSWREDGSQERPGDLVLVPVRWRLLSRKHAGGCSHLVRKAASPGTCISSHWQVGAKTEQFFTLGKLFRNRNRNNVRRKTQAQVIPQLTQREGRCALSLGKVRMDWVTLSAASIPCWTPGGTRTHNNTFHVLRCSTDQAHSHTSRLAAPRVGLRLTRKLELMSHFRTARTAAPGIQLCMQNHT